MILGVSLWLHPDEVTFSAGEALRNSLHPEEFTFGAGEALRNSLHLEEFTFSAGEALRNSLHPEELTFSASGRQIKFKQKKAPKNRSLLLKK